MKNFDAAPFQLPDTEETFVDAGSKPVNPAYQKRGLLVKLKSLLKQALVIIQTVIIWSMFLYIPVYAGLLYFNVITFISMFSLYYFISYIVILIALIMINHEDSTFR